MNVESPIPGPNGTQHTPKPKTGHPKRIGIAAIVVLAVVAAGLWFMLPDLPPLLDGAVGLASSLAGALQGLGRVALALLALPFKLLAVLARTLGDCGSQLARLEPLVVAVAGLGYAAMASTIMLVLRRDIRRPLLAIEGKENGR